MIDCQEMSVRHSAGVLVVLTAVFVLWPLWTRVTHGQCVLSQNCLPYQMRAVLTDPLPNNRPIVVNPNDTVNITCSTNCNGMNLTGCNLIEDWTAIVTTKSEVIDAYHNIRHDIMEFSQGTGASITFERNNVINPPLNLEMCNGMFPRELIRASFTVGNDPKFKRIVFFCGLERRLSIGRMPEFEEYDISSHVVVHLNYTGPLATTTLTVTVTATPTVSPCPSSSSVSSSPTMTPTESLPLPTVTPTESPPPPTASPVAIASLSTFLGIAVLVAVITTTLLTVVSYLFYRYRNNNINLENFR